MDYYSLMRNISPTGAKSRRKTEKKPEKAISGGETRAVRRRTCRSHARSSEDPQIRTGRMILTFNGSSVWPRIPDGAGRIPEAMGSPGKRGRLLRPGRRRPRRGDGSCIREDEGPGAGTAQPAKTKNVCPSCPAACRSSGPPISSFFRHLRSGSPFFSAVRTIFHHIFQHFPVFRRFII